jgi:uncharacterized protein YjbI with pentapeptide repeats
VSRRKLNLHGANLRDADLRGVDLSCCTNLRGADLRGADLRGAWTRWLNRISDRYRALLARIWEYLT